MFAAIVPAQAAEEPAVQPTEQLEYKVTSWVGDAAEIVMTVTPSKTDGGVPAQKVTYTVNTVGLMSGIYVVHGSATVLLDAKTFLPYEYEQNFEAGLAITGGKVKREKLIYDRTEGLMKYLRSDTVDQPLMLLRTRTLPPETHHISSVIYLLRARDSFTVGESIKTPLSDRKRDYSATATVLREENYVSYDGITKSAFVLSVTTDFRHKSVSGASMTAWIDKDEHYPVRIDVKTRWGKISATLVKRTVPEAQDDKSADENSRDNSSKN